MADTWSSKKALIGDKYVLGMQLGQKTTAPNLEWPLPLLPATSAALNRALFAPKEQRLSRDLVTLASLTNDMIATPGDTWGWFSDAGWFRTTSLVTYNARLQESVATLAWFYTQQRPWNPYYGSQPLAERLLASLRYYLGLQHENGGFATNFPEQNHPATTGFGLGHLAVLYLLLDQSPLQLPGWSDYWKPRTLAAMIKSAAWVLDETNDDSWVGGAYHSNQLVGGVAGAARIKHLLPSALQTKLQQAVVRLRTHIVSPVGYMYENYGPDFGYTLGTGLPYLGALYEANPDAGLAELAQKTFDFMGYNFLVEPGGIGFIMNDPICARTRNFVLTQQRTDEGGNRALDGIGIIREAAPLANAFLTAREEKATLRAEWASGTGNVSRLSKGSYTPHRVHLAMDSESLPTIAERDAALAALPYVANTSFTEYRVDTNAGAFQRNFLYVRRPNYYTGVHWGYRADGSRTGSNFLYHPRTGVFIAGQGDSNTNWGLFQDAYTDTRVSSFSTSSTIPTGGGNFTLALEVSAGQSQRTLAYTNSSIAVTAARSGAFFERIPLVLWPALGAQAADVIIYTLDGGGTQVATDATETVQATAVSVTRAGLGVLNITFDQARSVTLTSATDTAATAYFEAGRRVTRHLDITAAGTLSYTTAITLV